jgi:hypothetical protein
MLLGALTLAMPTRLWAASGTGYQIPVGLLGIDGSGVEPGIGAALTTLLQQQIPKLQSMRVEPSKDLVEVKLVFNCTDENPSCMAQIGKSLGVARLIYGSVRRQPVPQGGLYTVALKQLNVADATVEQFITEAVPPDQLKLDSPQLAEMVQRWVHQLLVEGMRGGLHVVSEPSGAAVELDGLAVGQTPVSLSNVEVGEHRLKLELSGHFGAKRTIRIKAGQVHEVAATLPESGTAAAANRESASAKSQRTLRIVTYAAAAVAGIGAIAAIGTWRGYVSDQDDAIVQIAQLRSRIGSSGSPAVASFLSSSDQLSSCTTVSDLAADPTYQGYLGSCRHGSTLASATTGLWVVAGSAAVVSIGAALLSSLRRSPEPDGGPAATTPPTAAVRLLDISPSVSPTGANLAASFSF